MIWQGERFRDGAPPLADAVAAEISAACRPGDGLPEEQVREIAHAVAAYAADSGAACDPRSLRMLVSRALHGSGEGALARRVAVLGAGWVRPAAWVVGGEEPVWVLDLRALVQGRRERLELTLFTALRAVVDALAPVWDETAGRGWLGLGHAGSAARTVLGPGAGARRAAALSRELSGLCAARLDTLQGQRRWTVAPGVLNLGGLSGAMDLDLQPDGLARLSRRRFLGWSLLAAAGALLPGAAAAAPVRSGLARTATSFIDAAMVFIPRHRWAAASPIPRRLRAAGRYTRITVHHAGTGINRHRTQATVSADLTGILSAHMGQGYGDIGYHLVLDYAGRVWEGRSLSYEGAHVLSENEANIGVLVLGNFERQRPALAQLTALEDLVRILRRHFRISSRRVYGHRDLGSSLCPGAHLYPHVRTLRAA